ncbi:MAG: septum formation inhibitor Maf [Betaproteobacteria bacterium]|nr:septum formation inhibitor Maf [Betaproteobacteria bacterium]
MSVTFRHIYLASRSPRRREILSQIGVRFEMLLLRDSTGRTPDVDESPVPGESPADYVTRLAREKAQVGWSRMLQRHLPLAPVLAADTTVSIDGEIVGKPTDREQATEILRRLSGRTHEVHTAVALQFERLLDSALSSTSVTFGALSDDAIRHYVTTGDPMDKAGAYGIQGRAAIFVEGIAGSYTGVMGLPAFETARLLEKVGIALPP